MPFVAAIIFAFRLAVLVDANPVPDRISSASGMAMPLTKLERSWCGPIKCVGGVDNSYDKPLAVKGNGSRKRGASLPLANSGMVKWIGAISVGTPAKTFEVEIDTGSNALFVLQTGCGSNCDDRDLWDPDASETAEWINGDFNIKYADGTIASGDVYTDNVTIAGYMANPQLLGSVISFYSPIDNSPFNDADGILGLGFASPSVNPPVNLFATLVSQNKVFNPTFSLKVSPSGGELYIGGSNYRQYAGAITYTRVIDHSSGYWKVSMDDIRIGDMKILEDMPVIIDTGANFIFGDRSRVATLYSHIGGKSMEGLYGGFVYYYLPCDSFPTLLFTFGGRNFEIPPDVFRLGPIENGSPYCFGSIVTDDTLNLFWMIGLPFLQHVYTVFDYSTSQIGFADLA